MGIITSPPLSGEVLSYEFEAKAPNPFGVDIDIPLWVFKQLKKLHLLERDRPTGKFHIQARMFGMMLLWDEADFRPERRYRAFDPGYQHACFKDSGYAGAFLYGGGTCSKLTANGFAHRTGIEPDFLLDFVDFCKPFMRASRP
jgi:hypothetical protein